MTFAKLRRPCLIIGSLAMALTLPACENMNAGGVIGGVIGASGGAYAGDALLNSSGSDGGMGLAIGAVIGGMVGMMLGSGAVSTDEMAQGMADAEAKMREEDQQKFAESSPYIGAGSRSDEGTASTYANGESSIQVGQAPAQAGGKEKKATSESRRIYLYANMPLIDLSGPNPRCLSNTFYMTYMYDANDPNARDAAAVAEAESYLTSFVSKCNSGGKGNVEGSANWVIDWRDEGLDLPRVKSVDTVVSMP